MTFFYQPRIYTSEEKKEAAAAIVANAAPDRDFYLLVMGAALFALFGIALDSIPVLVGAMIVAPLAAPILGLSLGIMARDPRLMLRSLSSLVVASLVAAAAATAVAYFLPPFSINGVFISFAAHPFYDVAIALIAGAVAAYGHMRTKVGETMTGIGIAVSLMPPLVAASLALGISDISLFRESSFIFLLNIGGILVGSAIVLAAFGIGTHHTSNNLR